MAEKIFAVLEHPHNHARRASWKSESGAMYCGICMRGEIRAEQGNTCPYCGSQVRQVLSVIRGGAPQSAYRRLRAEAFEVPAAEPLLLVQSM